MSQNNSINEIYHGQRLEEYYTDVEFYSDNDVIEVRRRPSLSSQEENGNMEQNSDWRSNSYDQNSNLNNSDNKTISIIDFDEIENDKQKLEELDKEISKNKFTILFYKDEDEKKQSTVIGQIAKISSKLPFSTKDITKTSALIMNKVYKLNLDKEKLFIQIDVENCSLEEKLNVLTFENVKQLIIKFILEYDVKKIQINDLVCDNANIKNGFNIPAQVISQIMDEDKTKKDFTIYYGRGRESDTGLEKPSVIDVYKPDKKICEQEKYILYKAEQNYNGRTDFEKQNLKDQIALYEDILGKQKSEQIEENIDLEDKDEEEKEEMKSNKSNNEDKESKKTESEKIEEKFEIENNEENEKSEHNKSSIGNNKESEEESKEKKSKAKSSIEENIIKEEDLKQIEEEIFGTKKFKNHDFFDKKFEKRKEKRKLLFENTMEKINLKPKETPYFNKPWSWGINKDVKYYNFRTGRFYDK